MRSISRIARAAAWLLRQGLMALSAFGLALSAGLVVAQEFPSRPVRFVSLYPPGGVTDIASRLIGAKLAELWKQQVIVDNRVGGGGTIGMDFVAKSAPDGHTIGFATVADFCIIPYAYSRLSYNVQRDFAPIVLATETPLVWAAHRDAPFNTLTELIAHSKANAAGVSYGSPALGSLNHIVGEQFAILTGANLVHVPYKGGGPAGTALAGGEIPLGMLAASSAAPHVRAGRVKVLAVTSKKRAALGPDWPTAAESGVPGSEGSQWVLAMAAAGTPRALIEKINTDINAVLKLADLREKLSAVGSEPGGSTIDEISARIQRETTEYRKVIDKIKLKLD